MGMVMLIGVAANIFALVQMRAVYGSLRGRAELDVRDAKTLRDGVIIVGALAGIALFFGSFFVVSWWMPPIFVIGAAVTAGIVTFGMGAEARLVLAELAYAVTAICGAVTLWMWF